MAAGRYESIDAYIDAQADPDRDICLALRSIIDRSLPEADSKIWHAHPVWFLDANPIVGFSRLKSGLRLLFWSGQSFETPGLVPEGTFKAAEIRYGSPAEIDANLLARWLDEARDIQWNYRNIVKNRGSLKRLR